MRNEVALLRSGCTREAFPVFIWQVGIRGHLKNRTTTYVAMIKEDS